MIDKKAIPRFALIVLAVFYLGFIAGAAIYNFRVTPYPVLRDAFLAAHAAYRKYVVYESDVSLRGYLWTRARRPEKGVTLHRPEKAYRGFTLVLSTHGQEAALIDMDGTVVHEWSLPFSAVWPNPPHVSDPVDDEFIFWRAGHVYPNGDLLVIYVAEGDTPHGYGLVKMDKNSQVIWKYAERVHHDLDIGEDGRIYTLIHRINDEGIPGIPGVQPPFIDDSIAVLSADGEELKKISITEALRDSEFRPAFNLTYLGTYAGQGDLLHTNTIELVEKTVVHPGLVFSKGQVIISMLTISTIALVDLETAEITWALRGPWWWQHDPELLDNGNILIFDNFGHIGAGGTSRLVEFDPVTLETQWEYSGDENAVFESRVRARQQRLPNGNTLITESQGGRLFEVTPEKEIVWEYLNPHRAGKNEQLTAWLIGGKRFDAKEVPFLETVDAGS